jgi:hypothetical protein
VDNVFTEAMMLNSNLEHNKAPNKYPDDCKEGLDKKSRVLDCPCFPLDEILEKEAGFKSYCMFNLEP